MGRAQHDAQELLRFLLGAVEDWQTEAARGPGGGGGSSSSSSSSSSSGGGIGGSVGGVEGNEAQEGARESGTSATGAGATSAAPRSWVLFDDCSLSRVSAESMAALLAPEQSSTATPYLVFYEAE